VNTYSLCTPRRASTIDDATSFRINTCFRLTLKNSGGITNTLRFSSGTGTSQDQRKPQTFSSRAPVFTANSTILCRCPGSRCRSFDCSAHVIG
jgi:hypothetical protein